MARSSYIDHAPRVAPDGRFWPAHSWRVHTFIALKWQYGDAIAGDIICGQDLQTRVDLERWHALGGHAEAAA